MALTLNDSRIMYLYEAVRRGSIRAAADGLDIAPSAVSRQITLLEKELDCALIERHSRGIVATDAGRHLIDYHREQLAHQNDLLSRLEDLRGLRSGQVVIVLGEGFVADLLAGPMAHFRRQYPAISLQLDLAGTNEVVRRVVEDEAEIGLVYNPPADPKMVSRAIRRQPLKAVVWRDFPLRGRQPGLSLRELTAFPLAVTHTAYGIRQMLHALEITERIHLQPVVTTNSLTVLKEFVKQELGVSCLPDFAVAREVDAGELFTMPLLHPVLETAEAHLITRAGRRLSGATVRMLQLMTAQLRSLR
ncbi:MAG: LysR substrate-binding domain-containing protein [Janthinobacterium lividum]